MTAFLPAVHTCFNHSGIYPEFIQSLSRVYPELVRSLSPGAAHLTRSRGVCAYLLFCRGGAALLTRSRGMLAHLLWSLPPRSTPLLTTGGRGLRAFVILYDAHAGRSLSPSFSSLTRSRGVEMLYNSSLRAKRSNLKTSNSQSSLINNQSKSLLAYLLQNYITEVIYSIKNHLISRILRNLTGSFLYPCYLIKSFCFSFVAALACSFCLDALLSLYLTKKL